MTHFISFLFTAAITALVAGICDAIGMNPIYVVLFITISLALDYYERFYDNQA